MSYLTQFFNRFWANLAEIWKRKPPQGKCIDWYDKCGGQSDWKLKRWRAKLHPFFSPVYRRRSQLNIDSYPKYFGFTFLRSVIGLGNSRHHLNQSDARLKTSTAWSFAFSRPSSSLLVFTLSSHELMVMRTAVITLVFGFSFSSLKWIPL